MLKKMSDNWTVKALAKKMRQGEVSFSNVIQRNPCWDKDRKSLLIHTMLEDYPVPHFYAAKSEVKGYDMLDGKQRSYTIQEYLNNEFALSDATPETTLDDGTIYELVGKKYEDLDEELQDRINDFLLNIYYFEGINEDEIAELFFRINNGKAFTPIELTRVRAISMKQINEAARHDIFSAALTAKALEKYTNEDLVIKTWAMLNMESPCLDTKVIRPLMESVTFTDDEICEMYDIYDKMLKVYEFIKDNKDSKKAAKKMLTRTHFLALVPVVNQSISDNVSIESFAYWIQSFFTGDKTASVSEEYNETTTARTTNRENIQKRHNAIMAHYRTAFPPAVEAASA